jgi:hypothetical protein
MLFFPKGAKEPLYSLQSESKVAHYIEVVQKYEVFVVLDVITRYVFDPTKNKCYE